MVQKNYYTANQKKQSQKFVPRRDLFPDTPLPPNKALTPKAQTYKAQPSMVQPSKTQPSRTQPFPLKQPLKQIKTHQPLSISPIVVILLLAGWFIIWPKLKSKRPNLTFNIKSVVKDVLSNPQSLQMLQAIGPYLEDKEQDAVFSITGIMEALNIVKDIMDHTYHSKQQSMILQVPLDPISKKIEMMKVLKPFVPENSRQTLDSVVKTYDAADKLNRNIEIYKNNRTLSRDRKISSIESINEIIKVIRPVIPHEYREKADKAIQMLKLAEAMESADKINKDMKKDKKTAGKDADQSESIKKPPVDKAVQTEQMLDSLKSMLNDEQKESMDVIMKMAQLLAKPSDESVTE